MSTEAVESAKALGLDLPGDIVALDNLSGRLAAVQWGTAKTDAAETLRTEYRSGALAKLSADNLAGHIAATVTGAEAVKAAQPLAKWLNDIVASDLDQALTKHADALLSQCQPIHAAAVSAVEFATAAGTTADTVPTTADEVHAVDDLAAARETLGRVSELMTAVSKGGTGRYVDVNCLAAIGILRTDGVTVHSPMEQVAARLPDAMANVRSRLNSDTEVADLLAADAALLARATSSGHAMDATEHAAIVLETRDLA